MLFDFGSVAQIQTSLWLCTVWPEHVLLVNKQHEDKITIKSHKLTCMYSTILGMSDKCHFLMDCLLILHICSLHIELF